MTKKTIIIDLGFGMTLEPHSFKSKGEWVTGFLFRPSPTKQKTFFSVDKIKQLRDAISENIELILSHHESTIKAISAGYTVAFGEVYKEGAEEEKAAPPAKTKAKASPTRSKSKAKPKAETNGKATATANSEDQALDAALEAFDDSQEAVRRW